MKLRSLQLWQCLCLLLILLLSACNRTDVTNTAFIPPGTEAATLETLAISSSENVPSKEPERITFVYTEDTEDGSQDIRFTVWQEESYSPLSLEDGRYVWEGLMYEMEGAGRYFDRLLEYAPKRGKVWKRPEEERMPYPNWHLEDLDDASKPGIVSIYPNKEEKFGMAIGAQSLLQMFIREPSDSKTPNPFHWEKN